MAAKPKAKTNWEAIERDYRAGIKALRLIGKENSISDVAILKRAKRDGWERDLSAKIRAKAAAKVSKAAVRKLVSKEQAATDAQVVEANAEMQAQIILAHRTDIQASRRIVRAMLDEVALLTDNRVTVETLAQIAKALEGGDNTIDPRLLDAIVNLPRLPARAQTMQKLVECLRALIALEREAFGVTEKASPLDQITEGLKRLHETPVEG